MENNENNIQNQEKKQSKGLSAGLVITMLIAVLIIGIGGGYLLSKNDSVFNKNETNSNNTSENNKNENKVISVVSVEDSSGQMTIEGRDKDNNRVWSYTTLAENIPQENINKGLRLIETRKGKVYLCDWGKLYILDEQTGKVLAQNTEHNIGAAAVYIFDEDDNLYTTSYLAAVDKFDTNAKLLKTTESKIWDEGFYWPQKMTLNGNNLIIDYGNEGSVTVSKETLEIIESKSNTSTNNSSNATQASQTTSNNNETMTETNKEYATEYIKIIDKVVEEYPNTQITCDLIYFNNDDIPDLVIGVQDYWISLYIYEDGKIYNPINEWSYGTGVSKFYDYVEKKNVVYNYGNGFAGAISYNTYYLLNSSKKFDELSSIGEGADIEPTDSMYEEVQKELAKSAGYYYNDKKISEEEFNNKLKELSIEHSFSSNENNYKALYGNKSIEEVKKLLK